ncbi:AAA family ATPase [Salinibaculum rarum]|uniref:AAA family ATPase n=1 Tax=Salinibaculum rarum TaxID=3058903 RepID=UPI00265E0D93|nr:AAA family ATPase [Salinibaculum sp. KK48]
MSLYTGYALLATGVISIITFAAGSTVYQSLTTATMTSVMGILTASAFTATGLVVLYITSIVVSSTADSLFENALTAPDGRRLAGVSGIIGTIALTAVWAAPLESRSLAGLVGISLRSSPTQLHGGAAALIISAFVGLYAYLTVTGGSYNSLETTSNTSPATPSNTETATGRQTAVTTPRTTEVASVDESPPERTDWTANEETESNSSTELEDLPDSGHTPETNESDGENTQETDLDMPGEAETESSTSSTNTSKSTQQDSTVDAPEKTEIRGMEDVDLTDYQFDWVSRTNVDMTDVGGMDNVKQEIQQDIVKPMKEEPEKAEKFDIPLPNMLLHGPPGTGKTYLAKALATELGYPFVDLSGSDITSKWVNESAEKVGDLFAEAEQLAGEVGGAVIFLDELDAVLPERQMDSHEEDRKVVNEFLSHLQESARKRVLFVGATNKRADLDSAATRNGRIDKEIFVGEPDEKARVEIFKAQLDGRPHSLDDNDIKELAEMADDVVAADIEAVVNQAARNAAYGRDASEIEWEDFEMAIDDF